MHITFLLLYTRAVQLYLLRAATASYHLLAGRNTGACTRDEYGYRHFGRNTTRTKQGRGPPVGQRCYTLQKNLDINYKL